MSRAYGKQERVNRFTIKMQKKLLVLFLLMMAAFGVLSARLILINRDKGKDYKKQVLSQQEYDSVTIPFKRGEILDANGTVLAISNKVYNVILDTKVLMDDEANLEPTLNALHSAFGIDISETRNYISTHPESAYCVLARRLSYDKVEQFKEMQKDEEYGSYIKGVWFEDEYQREYPNGDLACDVIGFTRSDNSGMYGLEEYYNDILCGTNGREYGYLNNDSNLERTTIQAVDGYNLQLTLDANIQRIIQKYLEEFNEEYKDSYRTGNGAENVGCIVMEVDTGNVLGMGSYPTYDLNDTRNTDKLIGMPVLDEKWKKTGEYLTEEMVRALDDEATYRQLDALWKNFCIVDTYEPGSVAKPFTVAAAIESGAITGNETYNCEGRLEVGGHPIKCHQKFGDGPLTVAEGVERSCNVVLMNVAFQLGKDRFVDYQHLFGFGLKTNIDLAGESRTASLVYNKDNIRQTELATCSFGQGFNASMIQMITGFCSLINGGYYYEPHVVSKITTSDGATVENIEPRLLKQTISQSTSDKILEYCNLVVSGENGTGKTARPAGYMIGGKTGTAETLPRGNNEYVVSFLGYAPADDPQIAIYVVVDRPNVPYQDDAKYATRIVRKILTEMLPYLNIFMTEELTDKEREELEEMKLQITTPQEEEGETAEGTEGTGETGEGEGTEGTGENGEGTGEGSETPAEPVDTQVWKTFPKDPESGYLKDPDTGDLIDPDTGAVVNGGSLITGEGESGSSGIGEPPAGGDTEEENFGP
ncbi:MAG: penicillin-binding transpeptidase domain-containing protein [Blautia sp.]|nr:penicillin-binding transpeptidase domain-containing protein [Lachnoclostridium sp.]MCM1210493.1 penicillin-binding transpeptidase domain-containing protein [Blautia sp.]